MTRTLGHVDLLAAPGGIGPGDPDGPPLSVWGVVAAPADEDAGFDDELPVLPDDEWPGGWGAARLGIP
jgi:hypothetical protein